MWIKTADGVLVNTDQMRSIAYNEETDITEALFATPNSYIRISDGDTRAEIATAMRKQLSFFSVGV